MKMMKIIFAYIFSLYLLIDEIYSQPDDIKTLNLDYLFTSSILNNNGHNYFKLTIPLGVQKKTKNLIIRVKEPKKAEKGESFSDPDIYVSQVKYLLLKFKLFRITNFQNLQNLLNGIPKDSEKILLVFLASTSMKIKYFTYQYIVRKDAHMNLLPN